MLLMLVWCCCDLMCRGKNQPSDSLSDPEPGIDEVTPVPPNLGS